MADIEDPDFEENNLTAPITVEAVIRPSNVCVLVKLESAEGVDANPSAAVDAIPVEADSVSYTSPFATESSNEATGSLVAGAPLIVGQAVTVSFKSRIKGVGPGMAYTASVKPPLHQPLQACGWRGQFQDAVVPRVAVAGTPTTVTLGSNFPLPTRSLLGYMLVIGAGTGAGNTTVVMEYSGRVATLSDALGLDVTSSISLPASWTYASTSPSDDVSRATDQPSATIVIGEDGVRRRFVGCRGVVNLDGQTAKCGYATFTFTGIYAGQDDWAPTNLIVANHSAPILVRGDQLTPAVSMNRKPLRIATWSLDAGSQIENVDDPNTPYGFGPGQIVDRVPVLKVDPLATLTANRNTIADIGAGNRFPVVLRHGSVPGNAWHLALPLAQPTGANAGTRGKLRSEEITLQALSLGKDAVGRDGDRILCFY